jgi:ABC-type phosphate/phosphonate transport system substrate-binding protein
MFAYRPKEIIEKRFQPLVEHLSQQLGTTQVKLRALDLDEIDNALANNELDLVFTTPGHYLQLRFTHQLSGALATLRRHSQGMEASSLGGVIFTRATNRSINQLADLIDKHVAIPGIRYMGAYRTQAYELMQIGIDLPDDVDLLDEVGSQDTVVTAVLSNQAEVGFVRTGLLEQMVKEQKLDFGQIKIINQKQHQGFPFIASTRLYPEWAFVALPSVDSTQIRKITAALLALEASHPVSKAAGIAGFAPPADYLPLERMVRELRLPPFDQHPRITWDQIWSQYASTLILFFVAFGLITLLLIKLARGKKALGISMQQQKQSDAKFRRLIENVSPEYFFYSKDQYGICTYVSDSVSKVWLFSKICG